MTGQPLAACLGRFLAALDGELDGAARERLDLAPVLGEIRRAIDRSPQLFEDRGAQSVSAARHLPRALALAKRGPPRCAEIARTLSDLAGGLIWIQNPNYTADALGDHYLANYAYSDLVGPRGLADAAISVGVLLLGPGLHYPEHHHAAEELYLVLAGDALWRQGEEPWVEQPLGGWIHHTPWMPHATKCGAEPLLALYVWRGALNQPAELCAD